MQKLEIINNKIYIIRNQKVMLDFDLAFLYQIETKVLKQAVRRNVERFPDDFMFELTKEEFDNLRSQFVNSRWELVIGSIPYPSAVNFNPFNLLKPLYTTLNLSQPFPQRSSKAKLANHPIAFAIGRQHIIRCHGFRH